MRDRLNVKQVNACLHTAINRVNQIRDGVLKGFPNDSGGADDIDDWETAQQKWNEEEDDIRLSEKV
eukprot:365462-Chlamydomonas_euryale.AAC.9